MSDAGPGAVYEFSGFRLDLRRGMLLTSEGRVLSLRPKSFALLRLLIENAGEVLGRDTIMQAVWPNVIVNDEGIAQCVRDIRQVLGCNAGVIIQTVPKRGYMLTSAVISVQGPALINPKPTDHRPIVAVLCFVQSDTADQDDYFGGGIGDEIIVELSYCRNVRVFPLNTCARNPGDHADLARIARTMGAGYMLDGSIRRETDRVRVIARLIELTSVTCIWAQRFDRVLGGLISTQEELGCTISTTVEFAIIRAEQHLALRTPIGALGPSGLYRRAVWHLGRSTLADNNEAAWLFGRAAGIDPSQPAPHSGLALVHFNEGAVFCSRQIAESIELASIEAQTAVKLSPDDADARATYAIVRVGAGQVEEALEEALDARRDAECLPWASGVQGTVQLYAGQPSKGREMLLNSLHSTPRDPRNAVLLTQVAISHYVEGDYVATVEAARKGLTRYPAYPLLYRWLAAALGQLDRPAEAQWALDRARRISPASFTFYVERRPAWLRAAEYDLHLEGLRKAGWEG